MVSEVCRHKKCADCPLKGRTAGPRGNPLADIMGVGESPGRNEINEGIPFVGVSGEILWSTFPNDGSFDIDNDIYVTNAFACTPPKKKKDQSLIETAARACNQRLIEEVKLAPRKVIIAMGNAALWSLTGDYSLKITKVRGQIIKSPLAEIGILPVIHPAALLRGTGTYRQFKVDIQYALSLARGGERRNPTEPKYKVYDTAAEIKQAVDYLIKQPLLAADVETAGFDQLHDELLSLGVCANPRRVAIFPDSALKKHRKLIKPLFTARLPRWIWHSGKFDIAFLRREGFDAEVHEDTMLQSYTLDETGGIHDLEQLASDWLGAEKYKDELKPYTKDGLTYADAPRPLLYKYQAKDVSYTFQLHKVLRPQVEEDKHLNKLYTKTLIPASEMLYHVEWRGMMADPKKVAANKKRLEAQCEVAEKKLCEIAGYPINPRSPAQVAILLYDELKLKKVKGRSTDKDVLKRLPDVPVVVALRDYRKRHKALSTYVTGKKQGVEKNINTDGRVHATFKIHGTRTGRLSSAAPNLQNIPRDAELRGMFIAAPGYILLEFDLNQAELRSLAALSGDGYLCDLYNSTDRSLHHEEAVRLFGEGYGDEQKMRAKAVNFGIVYGRTAFTLAEEFEVSFREACRWIENWFESKPEARDFIKWCRSAPRRGATMITHFGRKKRHHLVTRDNLNALENEASNFPHQSIASDINLQAAILVHRDLRRMDAHIVNLVHDSIIVECPNNEFTIAKVKKIVTETMEQVPRDWGITAVPFKADCKYGDRWGYLKEAA